MKIRNGFVSNSSSSSFVIASKGEMSRGELVSALKKFYGDTINKFVNDYAQYCYDLTRAIEKENDNRKENMTKQEVDEFAIEFIAESLYWIVNYRGLPLEGWNIVADEFGTEGGDAIGMFFYIYGGIDTDTLKIKSSLM